MATMLQQIQDAISEELATAREQLDALPSQIMARVQALLIGAPAPAVKRRPPAAKAAKRAGRERWTGTQREQAEQKKAAILAFLEKQTEPLRLREIAEGMAVDPKEITSPTRTLVTDHQIRRKGDGPAARYTKVT